MSGENAARAQRCGPARSSRPAARLPHAPAYSRDRSYFRSGALAAQSLAAAFYARSPGALPDMPPELRSLRLRVGLGAVGAALRDPAAARPSRPRPRTASSRTPRRSTSPPPRSDVARARTRTSRASPHRSRASRRTSSSTIAGRSRRPEAQVVVSGRAVERSDAVHGDPEQERVAVRIGAGRAPRRNAAAQGLLDRVVGGEAAGAKPCAANMS